MAQTSLVLNHSLADVAEMIGGVARGELQVRRLSAAHSDDPDGLAFAERREFVEEARSSAVGAAILSEELAGDFTKPCILHPRPREAFLLLLSKFDAPFLLTSGIHPTAIVEPGAEVASDAKIGAQAYVAATAVLSAGAEVFPFAYVGPGCRVGAGSQILPHAVLLRDVEIGPESVVGPGAVLGMDGFGYVWNGEEQQRIPQVGRVEIGKKVEIGALTTVDRATAGATVVSDGTKLDNLVQIGHNCRIGRHNVIASFVGVSGSCVTGDRCSMGGQVGLADHSRLGSDVHLGARTGINGKVETPGLYFGYPPLPVRESLRIAALTARLPDLYERIKKLEAQLAELSNS